MPVPAIQHNSQREIAQRLTVTKDAQTVARILNIRLFRFIDQNITWIGLRGVVTQLRNEAGLRDVEVTAPLVHFLARSFRCDWRPLDRKSTRLNSSHLGISYAVFCL